MKAYILNLLPRISAYSESLDKKESFIEKPWVLIDESGKKTQYIFSRDGRLLISVDGIGFEGTWEYIKAANTLWINLDQKKFMLRQGFIDPAIMILKLDGSSNDIWIFTNEKILKDISVEHYVKSLAYKSESILVIELADGNTLQIVNGLNANSYFDLSVRMNDAFFDSGILYSKSGNQYEIKRGKIFRILFRCSYLIKNHQVDFYCKDSAFLSPGDKIIGNSHLENNSWYLVPESNCFIKLNNGEISGLINFFPLLFVGLILIILIFVFVFLQ
jgi:hypothetical protein